MKVLLVTACFLASTLAVIDVSHEEWTHFKIKYGKRYPSEGEERLRREIFAENKLKIELHNKRYEAGEVTYHIGVNQFADMLSTEFSEKVFPTEKTTRQAPEHVRSKQTPPDSMDWRKIPDVVYPVQAGDYCESSWAFSAIATMTAQLYLRKGITVPLLSAQNLIDCTFKYGNSGCEGGSPENAFNYLRDNKGIDTDESYFYRGYDSDCKYNASTTVKEATVTGYVEIQSGSEEDLEDAVAFIGPVAAGVGASDNSFMLYTGGLYSPEADSCHITPGRFHHMVSVVGYGSVGGKSYWIIQNNWGTSWGEDGGYMRLLRNGTNLCGIATHASYPTV